MADLRAAVVAELADRIAALRLSVEPDEALRRALERDAARFGSREEAERRYRLRYQPGQRLYFAEARPVEAADVVVVNDDPVKPALRRGPAGPAPR
jgi:uridine kinase